MTPPDYLTKDGNALWLRHTARLQGENILTDANVESWILTCEIWSQLRTIKPESDPKAAIRYNALLKQWQAYGKQFGMFSKEAPKPDNTGTKTDRFGIPTN